MNLSSKIENKLMGPKEMKRVMVVGNMGSGKSTFAKKLQMLTGLTLIHLDYLFFKPNCQFTPKEEWRDLVKSLADRSEWIIDGNYPNTLNIRAECADTIIIFDYPRTLCYKNFIKRNILKYFSKGLGADRPKYHCDRISFKALRRIWIFPTKTRKYYTDFYEMDNKNIYVFKSPLEEKLFLESVD